MSALKNQVALVTGASGGIGRAIALRLAEEGVKLCLIGRRLRPLEQLANEVNGESYHVDLTVDRDIDRLEALVKKEFGIIDMLVHSAAVISTGEVIAASVADFDWQYRTNVRAPFMLTQVLLPLIMPQRGQIVFINSTAGLTARAGVAQYSATKHALKAMADSLREEVNVAGVRVISIYPGRTAGPMQEILHRLEGKPYDPSQLMTPSDVAATVVNSLSLPRTAEITDIILRPMAKRGG